MQTIGQQLPCRRSVSSNMYTTSLRHHTDYGSEAACREHVCGNMQTIGQQKRLHQQYERCKCYVAKHILRRIVCCWVYGRATKNCIKPSGSHCCWPTIIYET